MSGSHQIWERVVRAQEADLPADVARYFLSLGFVEQDKARYAELAAKEQVDLEPGERAELETLVAANTLLMLLQAKARLSLNRQQPAA